MDIFQATKSYESWFERHIDVVRKDLLFKHERMKESPFVFLRGTFYRWIQLWPEVCERIARAPAVLSVGDLHVENFGTWRDAEGRLIWGVNDVDETCELAYTQDLVRLATSATLAIDEQHFALTHREACDLILEGYTKTLEQRGKPFVLAERRRWLRDLAFGELKDPTIYWPKLDSLPTVSSPSIPHKALRSLLPDPKLSYRVVRRVAGVGSLGRPRFVALAEWGDALIAREAKAFLPSASVWSRATSVTWPHPGVLLLQRATRVADPFFAIEQKWIVRRLAPDCSRVELADLPRKRDERRLLRAMGAETANLHLGARRPGIRADLASRPRRWLEDAVAAMGDATRKEWRDWRRR
jgi:hypothetical protein